MKKILIMLLCGSSFCSFAQKKEEMKFTPIMTKGIGVSFQKFSGLNSRLAAFPQYETLKDHMFTLSLGTMHVKKNFVSGLTVTGGSSLSGDRDRKSSALRFLSGGLDFGYDVIPSDRIMLYPMVGVGAETYHAIFYKDNSAVDFNDVLLFPGAQNAIRSVKFVNNFITYRLGVGFALKAPKHPGTIGIQAGYTGGFNDSKAWKSSENQDLSNAPVDKLSRFHVSLIFGSQGNMMR